MNAVSIPGLLGGIQLLTKAHSADLAAAKLHITGVMVGRWESNPPSRSLKLMYFKNLALCLYPLEIVILEPRRFGDCDSYHF